MPTSAASPYDLTLESADFPPWEGSPRRSIVICSHPRSGSTLFGEAIHFAGGLGCPLEYLHRGFRPALARRWGTGDLASYVAALHRRRTEPNGVFSIKLFWQDVEELGRECVPCRFPAPNSKRAEATHEQDYRDLRALLGDILPNPEFVYLARCDRVRQAVSAMVAAQTRLWRSIPDMGKDEPVAPAEYDYERIIATIALGDYCHDHWRAFFAANGIAPHTLTYERLVSDYECVVSRLTTQLRGNVTAPQPRRMQRQSDAASEAMVLRFLRDHAARTA